MWCMSIPLIVLNGFVLEYDVYANFLERFGVVWVEVRVCSGGKGLQAFFVIVIAQMVSILNQSQGGMCICRVLGIGAGVSRECFGP